MEIPSYTFEKMTDMSVIMQSQEQKNMRVLRGRGLLNTEEKRFTFIQNDKRGPRSVEVGRTAHSRMVRRTDGRYTLTFRFSADEKYLREQLIAEIRKSVNDAEEDYKRKEQESKKQEQEEKKEEKLEKKKGGKKK